MRGWKFTTVLLSIFVLYSEVKTQNLDKTETSKEQNVTSISRSVSRSTFVNKLPIKPTFLQERSKVKGTPVPTFTLGKLGKEVLTLPNEPTQTTIPTSNIHISPFKATKTVINNKHENIPAETTGHLGVILPPDKGRYETEKIKAYLNTRSQQQKPKRVEFSRYTSYDDDGGDSTATEVHRPQIGPESRYSREFGASDARATQNNHQPSYRYVPERPKYTTSDQRAYPRVLSPNEGKKTYRPPPPKNNYDEKKDAPPPKPVFKIPSPPSIPESFRNFDFKIPGEPSYLRDAYSALSLSENYDTAGDQRVPFIHGYEHPGHYDFLSDRVTGNANDPIPIPVPVLDTDRQDPIVIPKVDLSKAKYDKNGCRRVVKKIHSDNNESGHNQKTSSEPHGVVMSKECLYPEATGNNAKTSVSKEPELIYRPFFYSELPFNLPNHPSNQASKPAQSSVTYQSSYNNPKTQGDGSRSVENKARNLFSFEAPDHLQHNLDSHLHDLPDFDISGQHLSESVRDKGPEVSHSSTYPYGKDAPTQDDRRRFLYRVNNQPARTYDDRKSYRFYNSGEENSRYDKSQPSQDSGHYENPQYDLAPERSYEKGQLTYEPNVHERPEAATGLKHINPAFGVKAQQNSYGAGSLGYNDYLTKLGHGQRTAATDHNGGLNRGDGEAVLLLDRYEGPQTGYSDPELGGKNSAQTSNGPSGYGSQLPIQPAFVGTIPNNGPSGYGSQIPIQPAFVGTIPKNGPSGYGSQIPVQPAFVGTIPNNGPSGYESQIPIQPAFVGTIPNNGPSGYGSQIPVQPAFVESISNNGRSGYGSQVTRHGVPDYANKESSHVGHKSHFGGHGNGGYGSAHSRPHHGRPSQGDKKYSDPRRNFDKSFYFFRKDKNDKNPTSPGYSEEYVRGRFKSFSSDYDSKRDDKN